MELFTIGFVVCMLIGMSCFWLFEKCILIGLKTFKVKRRKNLCIRYYLL